MCLKDIKGLNELKKEKNACGILELCLNFIVTDILYCKKEKGGGGGS